MDGNLALKPRYISNKDRTDPNDIVRVCFYARVSTQSEMQLNALDNQIKWYEDILRSHPNWKKVDIYIDKGLSGTQDNRPEFLRMISDAYQGKMDLICTREVSRFARNTIISLEYTRKLRNANVECWFVNDGIWSFEESGSLRLTIISAIAEEESAKISNRVLCGQHTSRQNQVLYGTGNILGYDLVRNFERGQSNTYSINEEQADVVRQVFDLYVNKKLGAKAISRILTEEGKINASGICKWSPSAVLRILKLKTYCGYIAYNKSYTVDFIDHKRKEIKDSSKHVYVKADFPAIISEELYNKAQSIRCKKLNHLDNGAIRGKASSNDKWGSMLACSCGNSFKKFKWRTNKNGETYYGYTCYNIVNHKSKSFRQANNLDTEGYCDVQSICDWKLDLMIITILQRLWDNPQNSVKVLVEQIADNYTEDNCIIDVDKAKLLRERSRVNTRLEALLDMRLDGSIDNESFNLKQTQLKERLEQIETELKSNEEIVFVEKTEDVSDAISKVTEVLEKMCDLDQKQVDDELVDSLIRRITPTEEGVFKWYFKGEKDEEETSFKEDNYILYDSFVIDFDTARDYRRSHHNYLRKNQWKDLKVEVYVRK